MSTPAAPLTVSVRHEDLLLGPLSVRFQRTLRLPDDGRSYPLPPGLGAFPLHRVEDYASAVPTSWIEHGGVFFPMHAREAMWMRFAGDWRDPMALKVATGMRNALTGEQWDEDIRAGRPQDYLVAPGQPWLDGFNTGSGVIRQFIAMPLGMGYTVEGQLSGEETQGGLQLLACRARPGAIRLPELPRGGRTLVGWNAVPMDAAAAPLGAVMSDPAGAPPIQAHFMSLGPVGTRALASSARTTPAPALGTEMGLAAGGRMRQDIHPDPHGPEVWDTGQRLRVFVHIVSADMYQQITGRPAPVSPVDAATYTQHGLPWFEEYSDAGDIAPSALLADVASVAEKDAEHGFSVQDDSSVDVPDQAVRPLGPGRPGTFSDTVR